MACWCGGMIDMAIPVTTGQEDPTLLGVIVELTCHAILVVSLFILHILISTILWLTSYPNCKHTFIGGADY